MRIKPISAFERGEPPPLTTDFPAPVEAWSTVAVLSLTYMFSFMDRQILVLLVEPIKQDLQLSDTQVSLLTGLSFALVYSFSCIPMGRAADLWVRKYVIIFGVTLWSLLTIACGFTRNFSQLFIARMGVGFGEAALTPTAYSMIADLFPPHRLARGLSVFGISGIAAGGAMPLIIGGLIIGFIESLPPVFVPGVGALQSWQLVLLLAGLLSLLMVVPLSLIREPKRHQATQEPQSLPAKLRTGPDRCGKPLADNDRQALANLSGQVVQDKAFSAVLAFIGRNKRLYLPLITAGSVAAIGAYGVGAWWPSYFIRVHHWSSQQAGIYLGLLYLLPAICGGLTAGWLADTLREKGHNNGIIYISAGSMTSMAIGIPMIIWVDSLVLKMGLLALINFTGIAYALLLPVIIQLLTPNHQRAQVSALFLLAVSLLGLGLGPTAVALLTDGVFQSDQAVGKSIALVGFVAFSVAAIVLVVLIRGLLKRPLDVR